MAAEEIAAEGADAEATPGARAADVLLADGVAVHVRPIAPSDADAIVALHARFSDRTRYLRYFSPYPHIPERDLHRFVNVDHRDREALVVSVGEDLIAVGRYDRLGAGADDAEVAFVVEDAHQGRGIGSMLLEHLAAAARRVGIRRFVAEVLPVNSGMLRVFADAGYVIDRQYADGVVHLTFPIQPTEQSLAVQWRREQSTEARSIARLLNPRAVAVYGVRRDGHGLGALLLHHLNTFAGPVYPIHPDVSTVDGVSAYRSLAEAPGPADLAVIAVPAAAVPRALADAARAGAGGVVVVSSGFAETGPEGAREQDRLLRAARDAGVRLVGPNCLGVANTDPAVRLNATLAPRLPEHGRVGFFSQSGALGIALLAEADRRGLGLSSFVSAGNRADVSGNDLLQYWQDDPATDVVLLYLETFGNPRKFARLVRRLGRRKPVVAVAAVSRPAPVTEVPEPDVVPLPGPDPAAIAALFARSGVIRVDTVPELFDVGTLLARQPLPAGDRVGIVTNSSALGRLAATGCAVAGLAVTIECDVGARADPATFADALRTTVADPEVDALVVVCAPPLPAEDAPLPEQGGFATAIGSIAGAGSATGGDKPVVATFLAGTLPAGVPGYPSVEEAVRALGRVAAYARWRRSAPGRLPELTGVDLDAARAAVAARAPAERLLAAYGVPVVPSRPVSTVEEAGTVAAEFGYPVVLKAASSTLRDRVDLGAVRLDLTTPEDVRRAYAELARLFGPGLSVLVQPMVPPGISSVVEVVDDASFGPVVGFGPGGVAGELLRDRAWRAAPLTDRDAATLIREPRSAPLLFGYRGAEPVDVDALADLLLRMGRLAEEHPEVRRLSLNPVLARHDGVAVLHASVHYGQPQDRPDTGPRRLRSR